MKLRHLAAAVLVAAAGAAQALPVYSTNLGTDPSSALIVGGAIAGTSTSNYTLSLSAPGTFAGVLNSLGDITITSITLGSMTAAAPNSGTFSFSGLSAGNYTLSISSASSSFGAFVGTGSVTPVPEAGVVSMALAGVGMAAFVARRRRVL